MIKEGVLKGKCSRGKCYKIKTKLKNLVTFFYFRAKNDEMLVNDTETENR